MTHRAHRRFFIVRTKPSESTINRLMARFRRQGSVYDYPRTGTPKTSLNEKSLKRAQESIQDNPTTITRSTQHWLSRAIQ